MCGGGALSILLLPLVARCLETIQRVRKAGLPKTVNGAPISGGRRGRVNLHSGLPDGCVVWSHAHCRSMLRVRSLHVISFNVYVFL